jgi:hypothetical protein
LGAVTKTRKSFVDRGILSSEVHCLLMLLSLLRAFTASIPTLCEAAWATLAIVIFRPILRSVNLSCSLSTCKSAPWKFPLPPCSTAPDTAFTALLVSTFAFTALLLSFDL